MNDKCLSVGIAEQAVGAWRDIGKSTHVMCCHVSLRIYHTAGLIGIVEMEV